MPIIAPNNQEMILTNRLLSAVSMELVWGVEEDGRGTLTVLVEKNILR